MGKVNFCNDEIKWTDLIDAFQDIYNKSVEIEEVDVLQGIALARVLKDDVSLFLDRLTAISLKGLMCAVLSNYDIDDGISHVTGEITNLFDEFDSFDDQISSIGKDGFVNLDEIETAVSPLFENFITKKEDIERIMDEKLIELFLPLTELGATENQIRESLDEIEFDENPATYIMDVFLRIADKTIEDIGV